MPNAYVTSRLTASEIDRAFLLVDTVGFGLDQSTWRSFCQRIIEWRGATGLHDDVIVVNDGSGHIRGLCVIQVIQSLLFGRSLDVPLFVTASAADEEGVILELLNGTRAKARESGCEAIRIWSPGGESWQRVVGDWTSAVHFAGVQIVSA